MPLELLNVARDPAALFRARRPEPSYPALPIVGKHGQSTVDGVYLAGEVAGTPLIKLGVNQGHQRVTELAATLRGRQRPGDAWDLVVIGSGASGFSAMLTAKRLGLKAICIEANRFANTVQNMTRGKLLLAEPASVPIEGHAWFEECTREVLLERWTTQRHAEELDIRCHEKVIDIERRDGMLDVVSEKGRYRCHTVLLAVGKAGNPRKAGVPGELEQAERVHHHLPDAAAVQDEFVFVYGGGDVAVEAALALCGHNKVVLATIDQTLVYPKKRNKERLMAQVAAGRVELLLATQLTEITDSTVLLHNAAEGAFPRRADRVYEMIGAELPLAFFARIGVRLQGAWTHLRWLSLAALMTIVYLLYAVKSSTPVFPFTLDASPAPTGLVGWIWGFGSKSPSQAAFTDMLDGATHTIGLVGHNAWYALLYTIVVGYFGLRAARRWGRDDPHQRWRYGSIVFFQVFFFLFVELGLAWFLGRFGDDWGKHYWRGWGLAQPFPLFYNSFFWWYDGDPVALKWGFTAAGLLLTFVAIPLFVRHQGMRFCTWICGCGGLAETLGDTWRHLAPKGSRSRLWEFQGQLIAIWAFGSAAAIALFFQTHGDNAIWQSYAYIVDFWLVAVLPIGFYPFFGGKIWCRYWCPLAHYMKALSAWFGTVAIGSNDKCITCGECSRYCQVGVDVMAFAKNQETFDNTNSSCIHCGICITVCPMDVLAFTDDGAVKLSLPGDIAA